MFYRRNPWLRNPDDLLFADTADEARLPRQELLRRQAARRKRPPRRRPAATLRPAKSTAAPRCLSMSAKAVLDKLGSHNSAHAINQTLQQITPGPSNPGLCPENINAVDWKQLVNRLEDLAQRRNPYGSWRRNPESTSTLARRALAKLRRQRAKAGFDVFRRNPRYPWYRRNRTKKKKPWKKRRGSPGNFRRPTTAQARLYLDDLATDGITKIDHYDALDLDPKERELRKIRFREASHYWNEHESGNLKLTYPSKDSKDWGDFSPVSEEAAKDYIWQFYDRQCDRRKSGESEQSVTNYPFLPRYQEAVVLLGQEGVDAIRDHVYTLHGCKAGPAPGTIAAPKLLTTTHPTPLGSREDEAAKRGFTPLLLTMKDTPPIDIARRADAERRQAEIDAATVTEPLRLTMRDEPPGEKHKFKKYADLLASGASAESVEAIRKKKKITIDKLNKKSMTPEKLAELAGIPGVDARRIVNYRDGLVGPGGITNRLRRYNPWRKRNPCHYCGEPDPRNCAHRRRNPGWSFKQGRVIPHEQKLSSMHQRRHRPGGRYRFNPTNEELLQTLLDAEGLDFEEAGDMWVMDSVCAGICRSCEAITTTIEPDQRHGWCHNCGENDVVSGLELMLF
jgi:hypothetical protein